jgi:putative tributyrin esterase
MKAASEILQYAINLLSPNSLISNNFNYSILKKLLFISIFFFATLWLNAQKSILETHSFYSPAVQIQLKCSVVLPANYYQSKRYYPVVYLLHGHTGNYKSWITYAQLPLSLATQYNMIIVLPDAGNSWYVNWTGSTDGKPHRWEDMIVNDLIPGIDKQYRTVKSRQGRSIGGLSMGGFGALSLGLKNLRLFGFVFSSAGAINFCRNVKEQMQKDTVDWNSPQLWSNDPKIVDIPGFSDANERTPKGYIFNTPTDADNYDPYTLLSQSDSLLLPFVHIDCGNADEFINDAKTFIDSLDRKTKAYSFTMLPGSHDAPYWKSAIEHTFMIYKQHLEATLMKMKSD